jgi:hypothetical protein
VTEKERRDLSFESVRKYKEAPQSPGNQRHKNSKKLSLRRQQLAVSKDLRNNRPILDDNKTSPHCRKNPGDSKSGFPLALEGHTASNILENHTSLFLAALTNQGELTLVTGASGNGERKDAARTRTQRLSGESGEPVRSMYSRGGEGDCRRTRTFCMGGDSDG